MTRKGNLSIKISILIHFLQPLSRKSFIFTAARNASLTGYTRSPPFSCTKKGTGLPIPPINHSFIYTISLSTNHLYFENAAKRSEILGWKLINIIDHGAICIVFCFPAAICNNNKHSVVHSSCINRSTPIKIPIRYRQNCNTTFR